jgi:4'-phosphopantetheinyl transferase
MSAPAEIKWPVPPEFPTLRAGEIHVWCAGLGPEPGQAPVGTEGLSSDEIARALSLHFETDRHRFVVSRKLLRNVLAGYAGRDPSALAFAYGRFGKPMLSHRAATSGPLDVSVASVAFNQSHSGPMWLLAVARDQPVGVDVEAVRDLDDLPLLEKAIFTAQELAVQQSLPNGDRQREFFHRWTRREAAAKFHGFGLEPTTEHAAQALTPGRIETLAPADGYAAALAYSGAPARIHYFKWSEDLRAPNAGPRALPG